MVLMKWLGLVIFFGDGLVLIFHLFNLVFSFKLFGIFVNINNKIPPLLKAGGTLCVTYKKPPQKE